MRFPGGSGLWRLTGARREGIALPTWDGVLKEEEYLPFVDCVRSLARAAPASAP